MAVVCGPWKGSDLTVVKSWSRYYSKGLDKGHHWVLKLELLPNGGRGDDKIFIFLLKWFKPPTVINRLKFMNAKEKLFRRRPGTNTLDNVEIGKRQRKKEREREKERKRSNVRVWEKKAALGRDRVVGRYVRSVKAIV